MKIHSRIIDILPFKEDAVAALALWGGGCYSESFSVEGNKTRW